MNEDEDPLYWCSKCGTPRWYCGCPEGSCPEDAPPQQEAAPYYDPVTGRCPHGVRYPHECREGCEDR